MFLDLLKKVDAHSVEEMAEQTGMDFEAIKEDIFYNYTEEDELFRIPDKVAVIREDTRRYLGVVGRDKGIFQYRDLLDFTEVMVEEEEASYVAGDIIGEGRQAFIIMETGDHLNLGGDDSVKCYFYVNTSHDSSHSLEISMIPYREKNGTIIQTIPALKWKHTKHVADRVLKAQKSIAGIRVLWDKFKDPFLDLRDCKLNAKEVDIYLRMIAPDPEDGEDSKNALTRAEKKRAEIEDMYRKSVYSNLPSTKGTLLGLYLTVVEWQDSYKIRKSKHRKTDEDIKDAKLVSILQSTAARNKAEAYAFALKLQEKLDGVGIGGL